MSYRLARASTIARRSDHQRDLLSSHCSSFLSALNKVWFQNRRAKYRKQEKQLQKALSPALSPCNAMMRNFYQTSTGRPYQYGATGVSGTSNNPAVSNQIRYPPASVAYSQFSPLTAAGIRQVGSSLFNDQHFFGVCTGQHLTFPRHRLVQQKSLVVPRRSYINASLSSLNSACVLPFFTVKRIPFVYMYVPFSSLNKEKTRTTTRREVCFLHIFSLSLFLSFVACLLHFV